MGRYAVVSNRDATFVVVDSHTGKVLSTHLREQRAASCAHRLNMIDRPTSRPPLHVRGVRALRLVVAASGGAAIRRLT
jgi:hypothetical protein